MMYMPDFDSWLDSNYVDIVEMWLDGGKRRAEFEGYARRMWEDLRESQGE